MSYDLFYRQSLKFRNRFLNTIAYHESETALDNAEFDYIIENNGTIEELVEKIKPIIFKINGNGNNSTGE